MTEGAFLSELLACDEAILRVTRNGKRESVKTPGTIVLARYSLTLIMGNSPGELLSDWGIPADKEDSEALERASSAHYAKWEGRKQPVCASSY